MLHLAVMWFAVVCLHVLGCMFGMPGLWQQGWMFGCGWFGCWDQWVWEFGIWRCGHFGLLLLLMLLLIMKTTAAATATATATAAAVAAAAAELLLLLLLLLLLPKCGDCLPITFPRTPAAWPSGRYRLQPLPSQSASGGLLCATGVCGWVWWVGWMG